jgi:hypothetical protein
MLWKKTKVEVEVEVALEVDDEHVKYSLHTLTRIFMNLFCVSFFLILILIVNLIYIRSFCFVYCTFLLYLHIL